jgi:glycosyltransferase involved in cell wall biosynthesis
MHYLAEDLLAGGYNVTLACDLRQPAREKIEGQFGDLLRSLKAVSVYDTDNRLVGGSGMTGALARFDTQSKPDHAFLCDFDEIASDIFRRASLGLMPPQSLRSRLGGIYHRPTLLLKEGFSPNRWLKKLGFHRMIRQRWFSNLLFLDEFLVDHLKEKSPNAPFWRLATPGPGGFDVSQSEARRSLGIAPDKKVFLFYGGPYRRKGLHLAVRAFEALPKDSSSFLLCAGEQGKDPELYARIRQLEGQGRALALSRYVTTAEETLCFCASDAVLLPYIGFLTSSGVMSQACAAGKPVIVSDEGLMAHRVRQYGLGVLFPSENWKALGTAIELVKERVDAEADIWRAKALRYAADNSRQIFREQLLQSFAAAAAKSTS